MSEKHTEILRLKTMLEEAKIPFIFHNFHDGYQIVITRGHTKLCDAIEHRYSYGSQENLLEIMGALKEEEGSSQDVCGYLTAEEVFKRFKYCKEHNTSIYKEE